MDLLGQALSNATASLAWPMMHLASAFPLLASVAVFARPGVDVRSVDSFLETQPSVALGKLLCNIGPDGCQAQSASPGVVIASPSTQDPNYLYTWTRDSALVFKCLVDSFLDRYDVSLQRHIEQFAVAQARIQTISNPSGSLSDGKGLGEPKFNINLTAFTGEWGRPQRDGPALRAVTLITYANWLIQNGYRPTASDIIWPIVRNDLDYVAQYWNQTGHDLWEEVSGSSFFTISSQHRALVQGTAFAKELGKASEAYAAMAPQILCFMQSFWKPSSGYIDADLNVKIGRSGKNAETILASIHSFDPHLGCDANTFQPCSDRALSNHKQTVDSFRPYRINQGIGKGEAIAVGRYIEDVYYGGNPWYLTTLAAAELLYDALYVWNQSRSVTVTHISSPFFRDLVPDISDGTYTSGSPVFSAVVEAVSKYADGFIEIVARYAAPDGSLAEQFSKEDGHPLSARDLTWSYAALLTVAARRARRVPPSWAAASGSKDGSLPTTCSATSATPSAPYASATATEFPPSQTPHCGSDAGPVSVSVSFEVFVETEFGQSIKMVGNDDALGDWDPDRALPLDASEYSPSRPVWKRTVSLGAGHVVEYKYIRLGARGSVTWEKDPNHTVAVPCAAATALQSDKWQY
ncbi:hypothetical protein XA68_17417 [Ophiocordyceps unilateralis]|uniref:Glucoamylase n=1 Tax=Ophiocordyceps unilateralis TaxID=268505 RepID=A0A2A9PK75_OPHUN|nr:hypothetical protein XA68_17417 [Ophiocordyceps unilateralis]